METKEVILPNGWKIPCHRLGTLVVGSGAAGLAAVEALFDLGYRDLAVATSKLGSGTSNNSGSDKQTYYKIGIFGDVPDSPIEFAHSLYDGGMMHGDLAYIEALGSAPAFFHLVRNGVQFPFNRFGAYVGYKTDHDPRQRATSAGPKTSIQMVQTSLAQVKRNGTTIFDKHEIIDLLTAEVDGEKRLVGALAIDKNRREEDTCGLVLFVVENLILATGGPGEMYARSVYPPGQVGSIGLALAEGVVGNNLLESQYGLASVGFRWNLSGTYMQVIPRFFSVDEKGTERDFLADYFPTMKEEASAIFLKGYQWPFHASRLQDLGSSVVDLAVQNELAAERKVFLDFNANPIPSEGMGGFSLENLSDEAWRYLERSRALQDTPYERLAWMNQPSIDIYQEHGVDLHEPLEVAVCAQHNNGGLRPDIWWRTSLPHLFAVGEVCGTHGIRPGGSALNAGQVGALRAAQYIKNRCDSTPLKAETVLELTGGRIKERLTAIKRYLSSTALTSNDVRKEVQERMSAEGGFIRSLEGSRKATQEARDLCLAIRKSGIKVEGKAGLSHAIQTEHLATAHLAFLATIREYVKNGGGSRGGYVVQDEAGKLLVKTKRGEELPHRSEDPSKKKEILETKVGRDFNVEVKTVPVRTIPEDDSWFETTWKEFREGGIFNDY